MGCSELWQWQPWLCLVLGALCAEDASLLVCFSWDCSVHCWGDSRWFSLVKRWRMNETDVTGIKKRQTRSRFWTGLMIRSHFLLIWIFSVASLLFRWTALLVGDCCGNNNKEKKNESRFTWPSLYIMNISSQGYLCNLLQKPLLHTAFHMSCSHCFLSQECV